VSYFEPCEREHVGTDGEAIAMALKLMTAEVREVNTEKGWRDGTNTFGDYISLLHSEASEALEAFRDHGLADATDHESAYGDPNGGPAKPEGVGSEYADILIRLLDMADVHGIDLAFEYQRKIAYNRTRPFKHGGRAL
jgi:NTP pyrophosphatase (non-canonical NTP hydrolase)